MTPSAQFPADIVAGIPPLTALFFIPHINSTFCAMIHCTDRSINICHIKASERHQGRPDLPLHCVCSQGKAGIDVPTENSKFLNLDTIAEFWSSFEMSQIIAGLGIWRLSYYQIEFCREYKQIRQIFLSHLPAILWPIHKPYTIRMSKLFLSK